MTKPTRESLLERVNAFLDLHGGHFDHPELPIMLDLHEYLTQEPYVVETVEDRDARIARFGAFIVDQVRALWPHEETPREVAEYIENALVYNARWKEFVDPTPATQPTASEPVRIPYEFTEAQVDQAFRNFIDSFNGDEAGDVEHVRDLAGNSGFAATGGNDMRAVFEKARAALKAVSDLP